MRYFIATLFLGLGLSIAFYSLFKVPSKLTVAQYIENDLDLLAEKKLLPKEWKQIKEVEILFLSEKAKAALQGNNVYIPKQPSGKFKLELIIADWEDQGHPGLITQMNLINLENKNKIWELGRTYDFAILNSSR